MLLKSLVIKDFRQFKGKQEISFATDNNQNVTMIMGDNGTGKTTLAQVFTWCLYGETTFEDKILLCKSTSVPMLPNTEETVRAELTLEHNGTEYTVISEQRYRKDGNGIIKPVGQRSFTIAFKKPDGTRDYVKELDTEIRMKEILPRELSKYFFFDGERIESMSKEIKRGRSQEFAGAVQSLLGLSAFTSALSHLKGRGYTNVLHVYEQSYDSKSDSKIAEYSRQIAELAEKIEKIDARLVEIDIEKALAQDKATELTERIAKNKNSEELARQKAELVRKRDTLVASRATSIKSLLRGFNNSAPSYFAKKLMHDALQALSQADKLDKGVPNVNDKTIQFLIDRKKCICGAEVLAGNDAFATLNQLLAYIPPKSIGNMIGEFVNLCEVRNRSVQDYFDDFCDAYAPIRALEEDYAAYQEDIHKIEEQLRGLESVGSLQAELSRHEAHIDRLEQEARRLIGEQGGYSTRQKDLEAQRQELANKDATNRKIETYKAYAQYMFDTLSRQYAEEESAMRAKLQETVNELFQSIYNGGFSLSLDDKYNIQINVIDQVAGFAEDVETSTAQSISVIFAFIAGVIKMARQSQQAENAMLVSEPYPLVMDAPLSAFDKTRIQTVCEVLPAVAEQVIIFIKDTDGDLADTNLGSRVGKRYIFDKKNEFEAYIV
jgi:DNA sulfur modification protein DndD